MSESPTTQIPIDDGCLDNLYHIWTHTESPTLIFLDAPAGGGSRQIIRQFQHKVSDECLTWHLRCIADEFGEVLLPKILGGLWKGIWRSDGVSSRMASIMHSTLPMLEDVDDQKRMQVLIDSLRIYREQDGKKIVLPDNRPLLSLVQLGSILGQIDPLLLIFEDVHFSYSPVISTFLECLFAALPKDCKVVAIVTLDKKPDHPSMPLGIQQLWQNKNKSISVIKEMSIQPWNYSTIQKYFTLQNIEMDFMAVEWWSGGWIGRVLEIQDLFERNIELPSLTLQFQDERSQKLVRIAALIDSTVRVDVLSRLSGISEKECLEIVQENPTYLKTTYTDPLENKSYVEFHSSSVQIRILEDTIKKHKNLVLQTVEKIRDHIGDLSPLYQVQSLFLLSEIASSDDMIQQHRDILAQERDDIWLQVLDLKMRFDLPWSKILEGYMYVGAVRYLSKLDLPNLPMAYTQAYEWSIKEEATYTQMELLSIMIDYQLQKGDLEAIKTYWTPFVKCVEEQRNSLFLFRKEILGLRLQSLGLIESRDMEEILQSVDLPIQKVTLIRMYVNQPESKERPKLLYRGYEIAKRAQFQKTVIDMGLQYIEVSFLEKGNIQDNDRFDEESLQNLQDIRSDLQNTISNSTLDWERFQNLCTQIGIDSRNKSI